MNNQHLVYALDSQRPHQIGPVKTRIASDPILITTIPPITVLSEEEQTQLCRRLAAALEDALVASSSIPAPHPLIPAEVPSSNSSAAVPSPVATLSKGSRGTVNKHPLQAWQVFKAIEERDVVLLMEARDANFGLLVQPLGGVTPLVHAMNQGEKKRDMAILLIGAISRQVNTLADEVETNSPTGTKAILKSIRATLKVAISYGIFSSQTELLSSFLQVIIMSEGEKWVLESAQSLALALRSGGRLGKPVESAEKLVDKWVGRELKAEQIASVADFVANAVGDLVLLGLWSYVTDIVPDALGNIPLYYFARDARTLNTLKDKLEEMQKSGSYTKLVKPLKVQIEAAMEILGPRNVNTGRERIELLKSVLDH